MKKAYLTLFTGAALLLSSCGGGDESKDNSEGNEGKSDSTKNEKKEPKKVSFSLDTAKTTLKWEGSHTVEKKRHKGTVQVTDGMLTMKGDKITKGSFKVDLTTIENNDLPSKKMKKKLTGHLMDTAFFFIDKHPKAKLNITGHKKGKVMGDLKVAGATVPVTIGISPKVKGDKLMAKGSFKVDLAKAKMKGMMPEKGKEDKGHVSEKVKFDLNLVMNKK